MDTELTLAGILLAVVTLLIVAQWTRIPYPVLLIVGGVGISLLPGVDAIRLSPDLVLLIILPPLLYSASFFTPLRDLRQNVRPIAFLAIGLVLTTMVVVAVVAHEVLDFDWPSAFVLGAIVSPTDPVAATSIMQRLKVPQRVLTIVEGESLINDATALVAYKFAVAAVVTGSFSLADATGHFFLNAIGGIAVGIVVGAIVAAVRYRLDNPPVEVTLALFTAYFAYLPAEAIGVSGVLAAVTVGIYMGRLTSVLTSPTTRIQGDAVWEIVVFLLNSALFILVGLQLPNVVNGIDGIQAAQLIADGALIAVVVMVTRILWIFPLTYGPRFLHLPFDGVVKDPRWERTTLVAWNGMRGAVSLAAALALPLSIDGGASFPHHELIIFLTFSVIVGTLLTQGLSMPLLIRWLDLDDESEAIQRAESKARIRAAEAAIERIDELADEDWVRDDTAERLRGSFDYRQRRFRSRFIEDDDGPSSVEYEERSESYQRLTRELIEAQRNRLLSLHADRQINDEVLRRIMRELDLEDSRLEF